jgi:hypothetical protein
MDLAQILSSRTAPNLIGLLNLFNLAMESRGQAKRARQSHNEGHEPMNSWRRMVMKLVMLLIHVTTLAINLLMPKQKKAPFSVWPLPKIPEGTLSDVESVGSFQMISDSEDRQSQVFSPVSQPPAPSSPAPSQFSEGKDYITDEDLMMMGPPPVCHHGVQTRMFVTRKQGPNLGRTFWRCPKERHEQCPYFAWTLFQPLWLQEEINASPAGVWKPPPAAKSTSAPRTPGSMSTASSTSRAPTCTHARTRKSGSNGHKRRVTCCDCGTILEYENLEKSESSESETKQKKKTGKKMTAKELEEFEEFQEFRRWQKDRSSGSDQGKR